MREKGKPVPLLEIDRKIGDLIKEVEYLHTHTPNELIHDADTILEDYIDGRDLENEIAMELFRIYWKTTDKVAFRQLFELFTGSEFRDYLEYCVKHISRGERDNSLTRFQKQAILADLESIEDMRKIDPFLTPSRIQAHMFLHLNAMKERDTEDFKASEYVFSRLLDRFSGDPRIYYSKVSEANFEESRNRNKDSKKAKVFRNMIGLSPDGVLSDEKPTIKDIARRRGISPTATSSIFTKSFQLMGISESFQADVDRFIADLKKDIGCEE